MHFVGALLRERIHVTHIDGSGVQGLTRRQEALKAGEQPTAPHPRVERVSENVLPPLLLVYSSSFFGLLALHALNSPL
jgi:hypothetical protein